MIDPGIGFGKTHEHNLEILRNLSAFRSLGRPIVLGASRKRFLGEITGIDDPVGRDWATAATSVSRPGRVPTYCGCTKLVSNAEAAQGCPSCFPTAGAVRKLQLKAGMGESWISSSRDLKRTVTTEWRPRRRFSASAFTSTSG